MERRRTSTPIVGSYFFSNSPVECLFTKVVLPVPPSPTRISLKFGTLSGTFIPARAYTSSQTHTSQNTRNNTITKRQHRTTSFASQNASDFIMGRRLEAKSTSGWERAGPPSGPTPTREATGCVNSISHRANRL